MADLSEQQLDEVVAKLRTSAIAFEAKAGVLLESNASFKRIKDSIN